MVLASILWLGTHVTSQAVTADEYPSEDELLSALQRGEIDDLQYERLREILCLDDAELTEVALDEIPDIDDVLRLFGLTRTDLLPLSEPPPLPDHPLVGFSHRYLQKATAGADSRYRTAIDLYPKNHVAARVRVDRTYSGRERLVARSIRYRNSRGTIREVLIGTYAHRFGLGTVAGYRGKLLDCSGRLDAESFRYPDFGGGNGVFVEFERNHWSLQSGATVNRDTQHRLAGVTLMIERQFETSDIGLLFGCTRLIGRSTGARILDLKPGLHVHHAYRYGSIEAEASMQAGERGSFGAIVITGKHHVEESQFRYDFWVYGRSYLDLTGGSRSGPLSRRDTIDMVGFGFATRRVGARGGRLRTSTAIADGLELRNGLLVHAFNADTARVDVTMALRRNLTATGSARLEYRYRLTRRAGAATPEIRERRTLGQVELRRTRMRARGYIAFTTRTGAPDFISVLAKIRFDTSVLGRFELGTNLSRLTTAPLCNDYASVHARCEQELMAEVALAVKLFHRYSRSSSNRHETTITLEVEGVL